MPLSPTRPTPSKTTGFRCRERTFRLWAAHLSKNAGSLLPRTKKTGTGRSSTRSGSGKARIVRVDVLDQNGQATGMFQIGETVQIACVDQSRDALAGDKTVWEEISDGQDIIARIEDALCPVPVMHVDIKDRGPQAVAPVGRPSCFWCFGLYAITAPWCVGRSPPGRGPPAGPRPAG